jgi:hypothetical protein
MMNAPLKIESEFETLPAYLQAEVLDFVHFVKQRHGLMSANLQTIDNKITNTGSGLFAALTQSGFIGCINTNEQLASNYKSHLNFGDKYTHDQ